MAESNKTPKYSPDNKPGVYDEPGSAQSTKGPGLYHQEESAGEGAKSTPNPLSSSSLKEAESGGGFYKKSSDLGVKTVGKVASAAGPEGPVAGKAIQSFVGLVSKHKSGAAAGGAAVAFFILLAIFSAGFLVSHELVTLEKTFLKYETKIEARFEKKAASKIMQKVLCVATKNCKSNTDPDNTADENNPGNAAADEPLTDKIDNFPVTSETVQADLAKVGVSEVTSGGKLVELKDNSTGANITDDVATDTNGVAETLETAIPEFEQGQQTSYRADVVEHAGVNEDPSTSTDPDDSDQAVEDNIMDGATEAEIVSEASVTDKGLDKNATAAEKAAYNDGVQEGGVIGDALDAANKDIAEGKPETVVEQDASNAADADLGSAALASSVASTLCSIDKSATSASSSRVPKIDTLLIRHGMLLVSLADELKVGDLSSGALNKVMNLFNGDSSAQPTADPTKANPSNTIPAASSYPLSDSAAYQSASGNSGGIAMDSSSLPTANAGTAVVNDVNSVLDDSIIGGLVCKAEGTIFGTILNGLANGALLIGDIGSFGATEAAVIAGNLAAMQTIQHVILPAILKYFTPIGLDGLENASQWGNNAGAGLNLASNDYSRSIGGNPVTTPVATQLATEATQDQNVAESHLSWVNRTLALSNPESLSSRILMDVPVGLAADINGAVNSLIRLPATLLHNLSSIFSTRVSAATVPADPGQAADITQYAFTDNELEKYDPIANEAYLYGNVTYKGTSMSRISMLGNPNTVILNQNGDEVDSGGNLVTTDLLHCYVDNYADLEEATPLGSGIDTGCYDKGVYNLGDYDDSDNDNADAGTMDTALDSAILDIYCEDLVAKPISISNFTNCIKVVGPKISDDIGHFRQYILDVHVMNDYEGLVTNQ